jgi:IS30 family transposase
LSPWGHEAGTYLTSVLSDFFFCGRKARKEHGSLLTGPIEQISPYLELIINIEFLWHRLYKNEQFLRQKYLVEGLSTREIAEGTFSVRSTIVEALKRFNIPLRATDVAHRMNKGQMAYGEKQVQRREVDHQHELKNIAIMTKLHRQGFGYHKIAAILNSMGIPTKNRKKWHATTIMNILAKAMREV